MRTRGNVRPFFVAAAAARAAEAGDAKKALFGSQVERGELHYTRIKDGFFGRFQGNCWIPSQQLCLNLGNAKYPALQHHETVDSANRMSRIPCNVG